MPTYQYACTNADCGNQFDLVQSFTDPAASECPVCGGPVRKVFSAVGVVFKGSGFYRTDSRASSSASESAKSSSSSPSTADSSGGSSNSSSTASESSSGSKAPATSASSSGSGGKAAAASS